MAIEVEIAPGAVEKFEPSDSVLMNRVRFRFFEYAKKFLREECLTREEVLNQFNIKETNLKIRSLELDIISLYGRQYYPKFQFINERAGTPDFFETFNHAFLHKHSLRNMSLIHFWIQDGRSGKSNFELLREQAFRLVNNSLLTYNKMGS